SAGVNKLDNCAVVIQGSTAAKSGQGCKNVIEGGPFPETGFEALIFIEVAARVFGFGHTIGDENQTIAGLKLATRTFISGVGQQANRKISMLRTDHLTAGNQ